MKSDQKFPSMRPAVAAMHPYTPGEQPRDPQLIKINTNENPYPPSPAVLEALRGLDESRLRKYCDPMCMAIRTAIARDLGVGIEQVIMGNGSDESLKMFAEAYVDPDETVAYLWPTYSLYPVFVEKIAARELRLEWQCGGRSQADALLSLPQGVKLVYIANPNPPIGLDIDLDLIRRLAASHPATMFVIDEAYIAYGGESAIALVREGIPNVAITRTFSKSHSLAGMRVGFAVGPKAVIDVLYRIKDSYNVNAASQAAALASWNDHDYTRGVIQRIVATRGRVTSALRAIGFNIEDSCGNFIFARHPRAVEIFQYLRENHVLVRYFNAPELRDGLRISIGTDEEMDRMLAVIRGM